MGLRSLPRGWPAHLPSGQRSCFARHVCSTHFPRYLCFRCLTFRH
jgi:hypothetical protein